MAWNSQLLGLLIGLDQEWISFLASMVQVRVFLGFLLALAMSVTFAIGFAEFYPEFSKISSKFLKFSFTAESSQRRAPQACRRWTVSKNLCLH